MGENVQQVSQWLDWIFTYGSGWVYVVLFVVCFIENVFPPFPGDSFIVATGVLVAFGRLDFVLSGVLIAAGGLSSVMLMYYLGRRYGRDFFMRRNFKYFPTDDIVRFEKQLKKWGALLMIFSRFVVGFRSAIAVGAGMGRYAPVRMVAYSFISYTLFGGLLIYLGYALAENFDRIAYLWRTYNSVAWGVVIVLVSSLVTWRVLKVRRGV
ncbi:MAG: DedA family protein [candidate division Zixibacteria bacterium]|nr:DedA family protein [candidate division Zixibacteria bacterium]